MRFLNPTGLWLLLLIPVLIIIYIIRARYEERSVASTYIWKLSTRFMKKKLPFRRFRQLLLFLCQLLMIVALALLVSKPAIVSKGAGKEYILIIDGSASMNIAGEDSETRFDRALEQIIQMIPEADFGTTFSIILAADEAGFLVERTQSETEIRLALNYAQCGYGDGSVADALTLAQSLCDKHAVTDVILYSDSEYETAENIEVVDLSAEEWNVSLSSLAYEQADKDYLFTATVYSAHADADVALAMSVDGKIIDVQNVSCKKNTETTVTFTAKKLKDFKNATVYTDVKDGLAEDNSFSVCKKETTQVDVLVVSKSPFYLQSVLKVLGNCTVKVAATPEEATSGYDLYIFDSCTPDKLPTDGSVWLFAPDKLPTDMSLREEKGGKAQIKVTKKGSSKLYSSLADGLNLEDAAVSNYLKINGGRSWESLLSCGEDSVLLTRKETSGMRTAVFAFDLHDSNLPLMADYVVLIKELFAYSVPEILMDTDYAVSDTVSINVLPSSKYFYVEFPDGELVSYSTKQSETELMPDTVGVHSAVQTLSDGTTKQVDFFVHVPLSDMRDEAAESALSIRLPSADEVSTIVPEDGLSEIWIWVLSALLLLILAEWGIYYYEQF